MFKSFELHGPNLKLKGRGKKTTITKAKFSVKMSEGRFDGSPLTRSMSSFGKRTPSSSRKLLKAALTKNMATENDTPNVSSVNNTAIGIQKAQRFYELQKVKTSQF